MSPEMLSELMTATWETLYMVGVAGFIAVLVGLPLGVLLHCMREDGLLAQPFLQRVIAVVVNALRSIPFIILLVAIIPFTRLIVGTSIGTTAAIVPLAIGAIPFIARIVETALQDVPQGLVEAGLSMGATPLQIIMHILLREALPAIIHGITLTLIALVGYAAMAGAIGGGGLGDFAICYGYQRFETNIMVITVIVLIVLVQIIQFIGQRTAAWFDHRNASSQ
jgi:D-methionine transport system permease protein